MENTPIARELIDKTIENFHITDLQSHYPRSKSYCSKSRSGLRCGIYKMEMGVPGLPPSSVGVKAEIESLQKE